jgi:hypothetical protein
MNRAFLAVALSALVVGSSFVSSPAVAKEPLPQPLELGGICKAPDMGATVQVWPSQTGPTTWAVRIEGYIRNTSQRAFVPPPGQAFGHIYEIYPGEKPRLIATMTMGRVEPGASAFLNNLKVTRTWNKTGREGASPPSYAVVFEKTELVAECNASNNHATVDGSTIKTRLGW